VSELLTTDNFYIKTPFFYPCICWNLLQPGGAFGP